MSTLRIVQAKEGACCQTCKHLDSKKGRCRRTARRLTRRQLTASDNQCTGWERTQHGA